MKAGRPVTIRINHDDSHARHVGRTADGRQLFLTAPFVPALRGGPGREFIALFLFDLAGALLDADIVDLGPRANMDRAAASTRYHRMLAGLSEVGFAGIDVVPFSINRFETDFGLIPLEPEAPDDVLVFEMQPGNYMAFFAPWDSGEYDT